MSRLVVLLHLGHLANTDALFLMATVVYVPVGAVVVVAAMEAGARSGVGLARRFMSSYDRAGAAVKAAAFLMVVSSSIDLGYVPSHVHAEPVAALLFSLDAIVLIGSSLLTVTMPALRPAALILLVAGIVAYALGGVQLDVTALVAKGLEGLALGLLLVAIVRAAGGPEPEPAASVPPVAAGTPAGRGRGHVARRARRSGGAGRPARRRSLR